jgi:hypothetical protein
MQRTEQRVLVVASIVCLLGLSAAAAGAAPAVPDGATAAPSRLPESPAAFAEQAAGSHGHQPALRAEGSLRNAVELMVLAITCGLVVAFYSAADGGRSGKRVLMRIRRR